MRINTRMTQVLWSVMSWLYFASMLDAAQQRNWALIVWMGIFFVLATAMALITKAGSSTDGEHES